MRKGYILAIDVGASRTRVRVERIDPREEVKTIEFESASLENFIKRLKEIILPFKRGEIKACAIGVAGRVDSERKRCTPTFLNWEEETPIVEILNKMGISSVYLMNDLEAGVHGLGLLKEEKIIQISGPKAKPKPYGSLILGMPGTGCGIGYQDPSGAVRPSEGGGRIVPINPSSQFEIKLLQSIKKEIGGFPCYDHVVSGGGIQRIMRLLLKEKGKSLEKIEPPFISEKALRGDPLCREAIKIFLQFFARCMQGAILLTLAQKLFLAGGIVEANQTLIKEFFSTYFTDHPYHKNFLWQIPVFMVVGEPNLNLLGSVKVGLSLKIT